MIAVLALFLFLVAQSDPNRLPQEEAKGYAKVCVEQTNLTDAQIGMDVDADKPCAVRGEGGGAMLIPDKKLSAKAIQDAGKEVVPVGQLWLRKWRPAIDGKLAPDDKLRIMNIKIDEKGRPMPLLLLGMRKKSDGLELVVYAKGGRAAHGAADEVGGVRAGVGGRVEVGKRRQDRGPAHANDPR